MASSPESSVFDNESIPDSEFGQQWVSDDNQLPSSPSLLHIPLPFNFLPSDEQGDEDLEDEDDELLREFLEQSGQSDNSGDEDSEDFENESDSTSEASEDSLFVAQGPRSGQPIDEFLRTVEEHSASVRDLVRQVRLQEEQQADRLLRQLVGPPGHPYRRRARTMSNRPRADSEEFEDAELDDELIMMEIEQRPRRRATPGPRAARTALAANAEVIDLTNVPDSPDEPARRSLLQPRAPPAVSSVAPHRNPRRQGLSQRTPSLTRSDGSLLGNSAEVIDLTLDDDAPAPQQPPQPRHTDRARFGPPPRRRFNDHSLLPLSARDFALGGIAGGIMDALGGFGFFQQVLNRQHPAAELEVHMLGGPGVNPLGANAPNLNYGGYGGGSRASPKPAYTPPPKAREGFTRSTVTSGEDAVVCPGCEEELQYDPDENSQSAPAAKKARTRKDQEQHYFWAVKECGHVYCKSCYENRTKGKNMIPPTFRTASGGRTKKTLCNVPDCNSDVTNKTAWVGIFL